MAWLVNKMDWRYLILGKLKIHKMEGFKDDA